MKRASPGVPIESAVLSIGKLRLIVCTFVIAVMFIARVEVAQAKTALPASLVPFFKQHCFDCHAGDDPEAGLNLQVDSTDFADAEVRRRWVYLFDRVADGEMPPSSQSPPSDHARSRFLEMLSDRADRLTPDGGIVFGVRPIPDWNTSVPGPGSYRVQIRAKAVQSEAPVVMRVNGGLTGSIASHVAGFFEVPPGDFTTIELIDRAPETSDNYQMAFESGSPHWQLDADAYRGPRLLIKDIQVEGPSEEWPPPSRRLLFGDIEPAGGTLDDIRVILLRLLPLAFRCSTDQAEVDPSVALAQQALDE